MAIKLLDELNLINSVDFEIDLGFSVTNFISSYRKNFHSSNYFLYNIDFLFTNEELLLFESFYIESLKYGINNILMDLNIGFGEDEYIIKETPTITFLENDNYKVSLKLLQKNYEIDLIMNQANMCLENLIKNLNAENLLISSNVEGSEDLKNAALCLINLTNLVVEDLNNYTKYYIITDNIINLN